MDIKELKRIAAACRKAGISHFKSADYEFTLTEEVPLTPYKRAQEAVKSVSKASSQGDVESDSLTSDEILFWSTGDLTKEIMGSENE